MVSRKKKKPVSKDDGEAKTEAVPGAPAPEETAPEETAPEAAAPDREAKPDEALVEPVEPPAEPAPDPKAELEAQIADLTDRFARAVAELENYRRRAEREREDVAKYAISNFARDMLAVADNLGLALASISAEGRGEDKNLDTLAAGVELTERELMAAFERQGITKVDPMGERFNHDLHQAMFEIEDTDKPSGTIVEVMQAGYVLKDRLLRPAMVGVTKGGAAKLEAPGPGEAGTAAVPEGAKEATRAPTAGPGAGGGQGPGPGSGKGPGKDDARKPPEDPEHVDTKV
ncbi:MAG: nucleotide exchange factor GrpE [Proteobacteria bacterium]|nr:nucleotide exchange factor GrpE [Pseudomonadota bacterium]